MIAVFVIASALVVTAAILALSHIIASKRSTAPTRELAAAVRCLDRILAYDDSVTSLSTDLRSEAKNITTNYYKEIT